MWRIAYTAYLVAAMGLSPDDEPVKSNAELDHPIFSYLCDDPFAEQLDQRVARLRQLTNPDLRAELISSTMIRPELVAEILRRGDREWQDVLEQCYASRRDARRKRMEVRSESVPMNEELLLLSALHVMDQRQAPIGIVITGEKSRKAVWPELPVIEIAFVNWHPDRDRVVWQEGGNYRHGRRESISFDVTDKAGRVMPIITAKTLMGGLVHNVELVHGERWRKQVPLASYCRNLVPGRYHVRATYAFGHFIGSIQNKSNVFLIRSEPLDVIVRPRAITISAAQEKSVNEQLARLELSKSFPNPPPSTTIGQIFFWLFGQSPLRFIDGQYDPEAHGDFIPPESPAGQLLQLRWVAVPAMIDALEAPEVHPDKRGWLLGLLYSITGVNDPRSGLWHDDAPKGVLASHQYIGARGWSIRNSEGSGGIGWSPSGRAASMVDPEAQLKFAARWAKCRAYIQVKTLREN